MKLKMKGGKAGDNASDFLYAVIINEIKNE